MRGFPLVRAARAVGWCPSFIPPESWHWWRWWTAGTSTTNGGGLCLRPDPRVPKPTTTPQHRVYRCLVEHLSWVWTVDRSRVVVTRRAFIEWGAHIIACRAQGLTASVNFPADD